MIVPFTNVIKTKINQDIASANGDTKNKSSLKYLLFNLHDTNISNFLRFLGYWKNYGYQKHVKFASSVRLEVFRQKHQGRPYSKQDYLVRFVYDN
jgi:hypothetical protein